jgi:hypothetical protein
MRRGRWIVVVGVLALAGVAIMAGGPPASRWADRVATDRLVSSLDAEAAAAVPPGAGRPAVMDWFKRRGMVFSSPLGRDPPSPDPDRPGAAFYGIPPGQVADGVIGYAHGSVLGRYRQILVYFYFDRDGRVIRHLVYAPPAAD